MNQIHETPTAVTPEAGAAVTALIASANGKNPAPAASAPPSFLLLTAHDYRSPRRAGIHFIADELRHLGQTRFFSLRFSQLSRLTGDPRLSLAARANRIEHHQGVDCYLWKTPIHPFNTRRRWLRPLENLLYRWYQRGANPVLHTWIQEANVILLESGVAPIFFGLIKQLNPGAKLIYRASDALDTINVADYVHHCFQQIAPELDTIVVIGRDLAETIPSRANVAFVPQGIDTNIAQLAGASPYGAGLHAVSVGSMLFDAGFVATVSRAFPEVQFHIIGSGCGRQPGYGSNVHVYGEMPFQQTLAYIKYANLGLAPYRGEKLPVYLRDTSLKLTQYAFFGVPAICPSLIAGDYPLRYGYTPGDKHSIVRAMEAALRPNQQTAKAQVLSWGEVTQRMLAPKAFRDTQVCL